MQRDPVCGQPARQRGNRLIVEYAEERYFFCSPGCLERFDSQPDLFTSGLGQGNVANRDRGIRAVRNPGAGPNAVFANQESDAGPG
jgi:YHS domain-containing protein